MTKDELKEYAAANRSRLEKQNVALGDIVKVLVGPFAGETGVVKGMMVAGNDFADPYYEVEMECEALDEYKCRKTLLTPNNVIGGVSAYEFEVIGNRAPKTKFKVGDRVVTTKPCRYYGTGWIGTIKKLCIDTASVKIDRSGTYSVPYQDLAPYAEPTATEEEKKAEHPLTTMLRKESEAYKRMAEQFANSNGLITPKYDVHVPTAKEGEEKEPKPKLPLFPIGTKVYTIYGDGVVDKTIDGDIAVRLDDGGFCGLGSITAVKGEDDDWQSYRKELAAKIAVAMITAKQSLDVERVMDVTDGIVERLKNSER